MARFVLLLICVIALSGCFGGKTANSGLMNQLQLRVINLERKVEEKDREIVDLKYQVKEMATRFDSDEIDVASSDSEGIVMVEEPGKNSAIKPMKVDTELTTAIIRVPVSVDKVQKALKNAGYYKGSIDGKIGPMSRKAIVEFQKNHGLTSDGIVGKKTWREMELYLDQ